jgi:hypothetical protein
MADPLWKKLISPPRKLEVPSHLLLSVALFTLRHGIDVMFLLYLTRHALYLLLTLFMFLITVMFLIRQCLTLKINDGSTEWRKTQITSLVIAQIYPFSNTLMQRSMWTLYPLAWSGVDVNSTSNWRRVPSQIFFHHQFSGEPTQIIRRKFVKYLGTDCFHFWIPVEFSVHCAFEERFVGLRFVFDALTTSYIWCAGGLLEADIHVGL